MTYFMENLKRISEPERVRESLKRIPKWLLPGWAAIMILCGAFLDIVNGNGCYGTLIFTGVAVLTLLVARSSHRIRPCRCMETITLEESELIIRDGSGQEIWRMRYDEIVSMEQRLLRSSTCGEVGDRGAHAFTEKAVYICLFWQELRIEDGDFADDYSKMYNRVILFPFYRSAWNFLRTRIPESGSTDMRC